MLVMRASSFALMRCAVCLFFFVYLISYLLYYFPNPFITLLAYRFAVVHCTRGRSVAPCAGHMLMPIITPSTTSKAAHTIAYRRSVIGCTIGYRLLCFILLSDNYFIMRLLIYYKPSHVISILNMGITFDRARRGVFAYIAIYIV